MVKLIITGLSGGLGGNKMKKKTALIMIAVVVCVVSIFAFAACNLKEAIENADFTEDFSSTDKEGSLSLINAFFSETLKNKNFVVTCKDKESVLQFTETVKDDASYVLGANGSQTYAYKKGDVYYWVSITQEKDDDGESVENRTYYCSDETKESYLEDMVSIYNANYCQFMADVNLVKMLPAEGATYSCKSHADKEEGAITASLTFEYKTTAGTFTITASSANDLVQTVHLVLNDTTDSQANRDLTLTFAYGSASITLPDTDAWDEEAAAKRKRIEDNEQAIKDRNEYLAFAMSAENVTVTVMDFLTFSNVLTETIADGIDCVDYGTSKTYAYMEEIDEVTADYYVVYEYDDDENTYTVNEEDYDDHCLVWYDMFVSLYDEDFLESADFTFEEKDGTMTYNVEYEGDVIHSVSVTGNQKPITQIGVSGMDENGDRFMTAIMLSYGSSNVQKPDLSAYTLSE